MPRGSGARRSPGRRPGGAAVRRSLLGGHAAYLLYPLETVIARAVEPSRGPPVRARSRTGAIPGLLTPGGLAGQITCCKPIAAQCSLLLGRRVRSGRYRCRRGAGRIRSARVACLLDPEHSNMSVANGIAGSQTGSQRPQGQGHARPYSAISATAKRHVRLRPAPYRHVSKMPPKQ
jgi:hypothetical protein